MNRLQIAAGNWKMHTSPAEGEELVRSIVAGWQGNSVEVIVAPPFLHLAEILKITNGTAVKVAAQNCHFENSGAYTGEISPAMLKELGVPYVIVGHSERREYFHENNSILKRKVSAALDNGLKCIFCCGEPLHVRDHGIQSIYVQRQIEQGIFHLEEDAFANVIIAYEPVWAIGTGKTATPDQAQEMHAYIRQLVAERYGNSTANACTILYGGSVKPDNAAELFAKPDVDGGLIGGASLKSDSFLAIANALQASI